MLKKCLDNDNIIFTELYDLLSKLAHLEIEFKFNDFRIIQCWIEWTYHIILYSLQVKIALIMVILIDNS